MSVYDMSVCVVPVLYPCCIRVVSVSCLYVSCMSVLCHKSHELTLCCCMFSLASVGRVSPIHKGYSLKSFTL